MIIRVLISCQQTECYSNEIEQWTSVYELMSNRFVNVGSLHNALLYILLDIYNTCWLHEIKMLLIRFVGIVNVKERSSQSAIDYITIVAISLA